MSGISAEAKPGDLGADSGASEISRAADPVWARLRTNMDRLAAVGQRDADPAVLAEKLAARARLLRGRTTAAEPAEAPLMLVAFFKGNQRFGIPVDDVIEVLALEHFSPVPGTPPFVPGIIHWRGDVLSLLDLGKLFGIPEIGLADVHVCLIVEHAGRRLAVVANEIEEIHAVPKCDVKRAPELPGDAAPEWLLGIHDHNRMILNLGAILQDARLTDWRN